MIKKLNLLPLFTMLMPAMFMLACEEKVDEAAMLVGMCKNPFLDFMPRCSPCKVALELYPCLDRV